MNRRHPRNQEEYNKILRLISEAMRIWERNSVLKLRRSNDDDADILIDFAQGNHGDGYNFSGQGGNLAHAFYPGPGIGGDVHLDQDENWNLDDDVSKKYDGSISVFYTLLHELGHSLGLGHSSLTNSIMFPWYLSSNAIERSQMDLFEDDILAIQEIYGKTERGRWGPTTIYKTTIRPSRTTIAKPTPRQNPNESTSSPAIQQSTTPTLASNTKPQKPDTCNTSYDAIANIRGELMIFKGRFMWRIDKNGVMQGYPVEVHRMWSELPRDFTHIDAAFERKDGKIVIFLGKQVFTFNGNRLENTHDLRYLGFDENVNKINAVFTWGHNNKTYIFGSDKYWK